MSGDAELEKVPDVEGWETVKSPELTKLTVNLLNDAVTALNVASGLAGMSRTDTVNVALQLYATLLQHQIGGWELIERREQEHVGRFFTRMVTMERSVNYLVARD